MKADLNLLTVFLAVADARSFAVAAGRLGVTRSAVSQAVRKLEDRMGTALVLRTTRSVNLTEAGQRLHHRVAPALAEVLQAMDAVADVPEAPSGRLRIAVSSIAERFLSGPLLASFALAYPRVQLDVTVTDDEFDIVAAGFDAGVRLGEVIEQDMIAVAVSAPQRQIVVASPAYVAKFGAPAHPSELHGFSCIGWRPSPDTAPYRWEFTENGREFDVAVEPRITTNDMRVMIRAARAGGGFTIGMEESFHAYLRNGSLVAVLAEYCAAFPGFFLYFAGRRNLSPKLRALIEHVRYRAAS